MGKRSAFRRIEGDDYPTPYEAVLPLLGRLKPHTKFIDPCCGAGCLIAHFESAGHICVAQFDALDRDARSARYDDADPHAIFLTNLPWGRPVLHAAIANLSSQRPLWTLLDSDWVHTKQAIPYLPRLQKIVSVGRVKWIPGSSFTSKDNVIWCEFGLPRPAENAVIYFIGRIDFARAASARRAA